MKDSKKLIKKYRQIIESEPKILILDDIISINHKPHPYTVGPEHIKYASDHHNGMLGNATLEAVPCAFSGCNLPYDQHTHNTVAVLKLAQDSDNETIRDILKNAVEAGMENDGIDGFVFVESEFKIKS